jgi:hypothetical protein
LDLPKANKKNNEKLKINTPYTERGEAIIPIPFIFLKIGFIFHYLNEMIHA